MRTSIIFLCLILSVLTTGCKEKHENESTQRETEEEATTKLVTEEEADWKDEITLNEGTQWQANRETTEGILKMTELIEKSTASTTEEYRELGNSLNLEKNLLIERCTMKGPSHENLHIYLQPLIEMVGKLQEVQTPEEGEKLVAKIKDHLETYHSYFI